MPKTAKQLTDLEVKQLQSPGLHSVGGVKGLRKQVGKSTGSSWILRVKIAGNMHEAHKDRAQISRLVSK